MKKIYCWLLCWAICLLAAACSGPTASSENGDGPVVLPTAVLEEKQTVTVADTCEFYVEYGTITDDVVPPAADSFYSHYKAESGKVYVDICLAYKNLDTKYEYNGFSMIEEDGRSDFTYSNITSIAPLATEYVHYLFQVPEQVEHDQASLTAVLRIEGKEYRFDIRGGDGKAEVLPAPNASGKTKGEVQTGEVISLEGVCEFYVEHAVVTDDVMPPAADGVYSHYKAENGKVYVDLCLAYKNLKSKGVDADSVLSGKLIYQGKYEYNGFSMIEEDGRSDFTYSNITSIAPLATEYLHYLFQVPEQVESEGGSLEIRFTVNGNTYFYQISR